MKNKHFWILFSLSISVTLCGFLLQRLGIHYDELNYFWLAEDKPFGDCLTETKPCLFYLSNYTLRHTLGALLWPWRVITPPLFYALANALSISWLASMLPVSWMKKILFVLLLTISPLYLLLDGRLMMEAMGICFITLVFAMVFQIHFSEKKPQKWGAFFTVLLGGFVKHTMHPALGIIAIVSSFRSIKKSLPLWFGILGIFICYYVLPQYPKKGVQTLIEFTPKLLLTALDWNTLYSPRNRVNEGKDVWIFLISIPLLAVAALSLVLGFYKRSGHRLFLTGLFLAVVFSLYFNTVLGLSAHFPFARYSYPVIWVAFICLSLILTLEAPTLLIGLTAFTFLVPSSNLWFSPTTLLDKWPKFISNELYYTGDTVHQGIPLNAWILFSPFDRTGTNMYIPTLGPSGDRAYRFLTLNISALKIYSEIERDAFLKSKGPKAVLRRQYVTAGENCISDCGSSYFIRTCAELLDSTTNPPSKLVSESCLP